MNLEFTLFLNDLFYRTHHTRALKQYQFVANKYVAPQ